MPNAGVDVVTPNAGGLVVERNDGVGAAEPKPPDGAPNAGAALSVAVFTVEPNVGVEALLVKPPKVEAKRRA